MKKIMQTILLLLLIVLLPTWSWGQIPRNPNKTDKKGQKQGKWTILYDKEWNITQNQDSTLYYRIITYKNNQPKGIVNDFYLNGQKQWEGVLLAENPDKIEGKATWFYESGKIEMEQWHEKGIIQHTKTYYEKGALKEVYGFRDGKKEGQYYAYYPNSKIKVKGRFRQDQQDDTWTTYYEDGTQEQKIDFVEGEQRNWEYYKEKGKTFLNNKEYKKAIPLFEKALAYYPKKDTIDNLNYAALTGAFLGKSFYNLKDYKNAIPYFIKAVNSFVEAPKGQEEGYYWFIYHIGFMYMQLGNDTKNYTPFYEKASDWYIRSIQFSEKYKLTHDEKYFYAHRTIFQFFARNINVKSNFPYALAYFKMLEKDLDKNYKDWAKVGHFISKYYYAKNNFPKLEEILEKQQNIILEKEGKENTNYFFTLTNYVAIYVKNEKDYHKADSIFKIAEPLQAKVTISDKLRHNFLTSYMRLYLSKEFTNLKNIGKYFAQYENLTIKVYGKKSNIYQYYFRIFRIMYNWHNRNYHRVKEETEILEQYIFEKNTKDVEVLKYVLLMYKQFGNTEGIIRMYDKISKIPQLQITEVFEENIRYIYISALISIGDFVQAEQALETWLKELKDNSQNYIRVKSLQAIFYQETKQQEKAEQIYLKLLDGELSENSQYSINNNLGLIYFDLDKYDKSLRYYEKSLEIAKKQENGVVAVLMNIAGIYEKLFQTEKAINTLLEAEKYSLEEGLFGTHIRIQNTLSVLLSKSPNIKDQEKALAIQLKNKEEVLKIGGKQDAIYTLILANLATIYDRMGEYEKAEKLYTETLDERLDKYQEALANMSEEEKNKFMQGDATLYVNYQAFVLNRALNWAGIVAEEQVDKKILSHFFNTRIKTKGMLLDATSKIRKNILSSGDTSLIQKYRTWEEFKAMIAQANSLSEEERKNAKNDLSELKEKANDLEKDLSLASQNFKNTFQEKELTWKDLQKELKEGEVLIEMVSMKAIGKIKKTMYSFGLTSYAENDYRVISKVFPESDADKKGLKIGDKIYQFDGQEVKDLTLKEQEKLAKKDKLTFTIENAQKEQKNFTLQKDSLDIEKYGTNEIQEVYLALIITPETQEYPEALILDNRKELDKKYINYYNNSIKYQRKDKYSYQQFWKPIANKIKAIYPSGNKVYFSPDGVYNKINIQTLRNPKTDKYTFDELDIQILSNPKDLLQKNTEENSKKSAVLLGRPSYDMGEKEHIKKNKETQERSGSNSLKDLSSLQSIRFTDLVGTEKEVDKINDLFQEKTWQVTVYKGKDALEERVKKLQSPKVLHIATHGFFIDATNSKINPMLRSGLALAGIHTYLNAEEKYNTEDGILTAYEASALNLDNTDLVVLSACETGLGKVQNGEGVYGLQRAFQIAGAKTILMSLWTVNDDATQKLMTYFYESWLKGTTKRESFKIAQTKLREEFPHPYYWGAFVMIGE